MEVGQDLNYHILELLLVIDPRLGTPKKSWEWNKQNDILTIISLSRMTVLPLFFHYFYFRSHIVIAAFSLFLPLDIEIHCFLFNFCEVPPVGRSKLWKLKKLKYSRCSKACLKEIINPCHVLTNTWISPFTLRVILVFQT